MVRGTGREEEGPPPFDALALQISEVPPVEPGAPISKQATCGVGIIVEGDGEKLTLIEIGGLPFPDLEVLYCLLGRCRDDILLRIAKGAI